ncbi:MAG: hypothetical protein R3F31_04565 [Verrucomicrobiales bacterium]
MKIGESAGGDPLNAVKLFSLLHVLDHCERLAEHIGDRPRASAYASCTALHPEGQQMAGELESLGEQVGARKAVAILSVLEQSAATLEADHPGFRQRFIGSAAHGELSAANWIGPSMGPGGCGGSCIMPGGWPFTGPNSISQCRSIPKPTDPISTAGTWGFGRGLSRRIRAALHAFKLST